MNGYILVKLTDVFALSVLNRTKMARATLVFTLKGERGFEVIQQISFFIHVYFFKKFDLSDRSLNIVGFSKNSAYFL